MKNTQQTNEKRKGGFPLLEFALSAAIAAGAGYYVSHKEEIDREAKKQIEKLAKKWEEKRPDVEKKVKKVWGEVSKQAIASYCDVRAQLVKALEKENLKKQGKMLKEQYEKIVADVIKTAKKKGYLTSATEKKLQEIFNTDWEQVKLVMKKLVAEGAKKTAATLRKAKVEKKVKKVRKSVQKAAKGAKRSVKKAEEKIAKKVAKKAVKRKNSRR